MTPSHTGRTSRARGAAWEAYLDAYHATLRAQGRAVIVRVPTEATVIGRTTRDERGRSAFRAAWQARSGVDYVGAVRMGRSAAPVAPVALEAKACVTVRWDFAGALGSRTPSAQWAELGAMHGIGGLALVLLDWGARGRWVWRYESLAALRGSGIASAASEDAERMGAWPMGAAWLDTVIERIGGAM